MTVDTLPPAPEASLASVSQPPTIGMVLHKPFPPDPRVDREAKSLMAAGYRVKLLCLGREGEPVEDVIDGLPVVRTFLKTTTDNTRQTLTLEPYNSRLNRLVIRLGPAKVSFKVPRHYPFHSTRDPRSGVTTHYRGPLRLSVPGQWHNIQDWVTHNGGLQAAWRQSGFIDNFWLHAMQRFIRTHGVDILHVHDLPLVYSGILAAESENIPVVADLHENWPALVDINKGKYKKARDKKFHTKARWEAHEQFCMAHVDHIIVVADAAKARLMDTGVPGEKITVVSNTIDVDAFMAKPLDDEHIREFDGKFVVSYVGGFGPHRGIDTLLDAAKLLEDKIPNLCLYLAGADGPTSTTYLDFCKTKATELGLDSICYFTGWADDNRYRTYTTLSHIGVVPHKSNPHTETTMPNKIYNYMLIKRPVICSNLAPLQAVIDDTGAGLTFEESNPEALAEAIYSLYADETRRSALAEAGYDWVIKKYNWTETAKGLTAIYQQRFPVHCVP